MRKLALCLPAALLLALVAFLLATGFQKQARAESGASSDEAKEILAFLASDAAFNLKLVRLEELRTLEEEGVDVDLERLARGEDLRLGIYAAVALGRQKTAAAKNRLKEIVEDGDAPISARAASLAGIAYQYEDEDDLDFLERSSRGNSKLRWQYLSVRKRVYGKED